MRLNHMKRIMRKLRNELMSKGLDCEAIRIDEFTDKQFFFPTDPDNLPLEFYEN